MLRGVLVITGAGRQPGGLDCPIGLPPTLKVSIVGEGNLQTPPCMA